MPSAATLLGPPAVAAKPVVVPTGNLDLKEPAAEDTLMSETSDMDAAGDPPMGLTENSAPTYLSSGNPCLDFFFHVVPRTPSDKLTQLLELSWAHDPLTTLKLLCNLRGVRGTGKSDRENFYKAAIWLYKKHPKTLALNAGAFVDFGYLKDLPEILYRILEGAGRREGLSKREGCWRERTRGKIKGGRKRGREFDDSEDEDEDEEREHVVKKKDEEMCSVISKEEARVLRKEREIAKARKAVEKYNSDSSYRLWYDSVCDVFANLLKADMQTLKSEDPSKISLAAKWCPSIDSSYDKTILICEGIARRVFSRECYQEYVDIEEAHFAYRVRDRLRKQVLVPLRKALQLPEVYMSANNWSSLPYNRVASVAMKNYNSLFQNHDKERFKEFLEKVKSGKAKIAAGALLPHEIIKSLDAKNESGAEVAELQWSRMVEDVSKKGKLTNCLAVSDVSWSMSGLPMEVSVALGLLVSELSEEPWKGKVITFSENPNLHLIQGDSLKSKTDSIRDMNWGGSTNFQKVFDRILKVAVENKLSEDQLIKRLFVFSDMEFDCANKQVDWPKDEDEDEDEDKHKHKDEDEDEDEDEAEDEAEDEDEDEDEEMNRRMFEKKAEKAQKQWETDYQKIQRKFKECGYNKVPEIVFWNLRYSHSTPVVAKQTGVAMLSGFSKNLLTLFLNEGGIVNAEDVMEQAISGDEYKKLVIYD